MTKHIGCLPLIVLVIIAIEVLSGHFGWFVLVCGMILCIPLSVALTLLAKGEASSVAEDRRNVAERKSMYYRNQTHKAKPQEEYDGKFYYERAEKYADKGAYDEAIEDDTQAIKRGYKKAYYKRANTKRKLKDYKGAIADFSEAIRLEPDCATYYRDRGNAKQATGDYKGAIADYTQSIRLGFGNSSVKKSLEECQQKEAERQLQRTRIKVDNGEIEEALRDMEQLGQSVPINSKLCQQISDIYNSCGIRFAEEGQYARVWDIYHQTKSFGVECFTSYGQALFKGYLQAAKRKIVVLVHKVGQ